MEQPTGLSESETTFFAGAKNFRKNYLKLLDRKLFAGSRLGFQNPHAITFIEVRKLSIVSS